MPTHLPALTRLPSPLPLPLADPETSPFTAPAFQEKRAEAMKSLKVGWQ